MLAEGVVIWVVGYVDVLLSGKEDPALLLRGDEVSRNWTTVVFVAEAWMLGPGEREGGGRRWENKGIYLSTMQSSLFWFFLRLS